VSHRSERPKSGLQSYHQGVALDVSYVPDATDRPGFSELYRLCHRERFFELDVELAHRVICRNLAMRELHRAELASLAINLRRLGPPYGVRTTPSLAKCTLSSAISAFWLLAAL